MYSHVRACAKMHHDLRVSTFLQIAKNLGISHTGSICEAALRLDSTRLLHVCRSFVTGHERHMRAKLQSPRRGSDGSAR